MDCVTDFLIVFCLWFLPVPVESVFIVHMLRKFYFAYKFSVYPKVSSEMLKKILESIGIYSQGLGESLNQIKKPCQCFQKFYPLI